MGKRPKLQKQTQITNPSPIVTPSSMVEMESIPEHLESETTHVQISKTPTPTRIKSAKPGLHKKSHSVMNLTTKKSKSKAKMKQSDAVVVVKEKKKNKNKLKQSASLS